MERNEYLNRIAELSERIAALPKGYISKKTVNGKVYFYHQWSENGVKKSRYLRDEELKALSDRIGERKRIRDEIRTLKAGMASSGTSKSDPRLRCTLMHKRIRVAELELDRETGFIQKIGSVFAPEHLPVGVPMKKGIADRAALNEWWSDRAIPASRSGVREAMETLGIRDTKTLLPRSFGLSLSDQYWIRPVDSGLTWESVNYFQNPFSDDIGDVLFGAYKKTDALDFSSPDSTSDGNLKKRWKIIDGKRCLVKGGSNPYRQQPFNEVIATGIARRLGIPCVPYTVIWDKGAPYSVCEDFVDENTELIPAWRIIQTRKKDNNTSVYAHFVKCAEALGIPGVREFLDRMIVLDYIIANEDRHLNNFGALRDAETLEWLGMAPIYDSGSSLGYDRGVPLMRNDAETVCKPFKKRHSDQLGLVRSFDWIDFDALADARDLIVSVLSDKKAEDYIGADRVNVIADLAVKRVKDVLSAAVSGERTAADSLFNDVGHNIAAAYNAGDDSESDNDLIDI